jgi:penicillin amidase
VEKTETRQLPQADAPFDIVWDQHGIAHVYASTVADAYRGMGYAAGSERLWQIHLSCAYANGEAAALLGPRFVAQDAFQRACNVDGRQTGLIDSDGDWIVDAYLEGLNASVDHLEQIPPEFLHAGAKPRHFNRADVAARYRFTCWFQHKSWTEKMLLGKLMATHGVEYFKGHVTHFSDEDAELIERLKSPLRDLRTESFSLAYADFNHTRLSGSNNWVVNGTRSESGKPMLAMDPHQAHSIPNTFFYVHLHAGDWDAFGTAFPGVPYFMMGYNRDIAWGLTTGMVDCYDVYVEKIREHQHLVDENTQQWTEIGTRTETIAVKGAQAVEIRIDSTTHGPLLESLTVQLGLAEATHSDYATALNWSLAHVPTSAGALAQLPLATSAEEFGDKLFENDICPLVNNIICVDKDDHIRRFIATTMSARQGVTGTVPMAGWDARYNFASSTKADLIVEIDPPDGFAITANNDTMGESGPFYIHNFPAQSARADRIRQILTSKEKFSAADFRKAQLDLLDLQAARVVPGLVGLLQESNEPALLEAAALLDQWDCRANTDSAAACLYYPFLDRSWHRTFMRDVLKNPLLNAIPGAAPGLTLFEIEDFLVDGSPWLQHREALVACVHTLMQHVVTNVTASLGSDPKAWRWGDLQQISIGHRLAAHEPWQHMQVGPVALGGSGTTLAMAMHLGSGPSEDQARQGAIACPVYHGPAYRLVVDLADPDHADLVIAGGNGGRADSPYSINQFEAWVQGDSNQLSLRREELEAELVIAIVR